MLGTAIWSVKLQKVLEYFGIQSLKMFHNKTNHTKEALIYRASSVDDMFLVSKLKKQD